MNPSLVYYMYNLHYSGTSDKYISTNTKLTRHKGTEQRKPLYGSASEVYSVTVTVSVQHMHTHHAVLTMLADTSLVTCCPSPTGVFTAGEGEGVL